MPSVPSHPYLPSTEAAKDFHLTNDYIGALCRTGKVEGKLVGRLWYVNVESLSTYLAHMREARLAQRKTLSMQWRKAWAAAAVVVLTLVAPQPSHAASLFENFDIAFVPYLSAEIAENYLAAVSAAAESQALGWQAFGETVADVAAQAYEFVASTEPAHQTVGEYTQVRPPLPYFGNIIHNGRDLMAALTAPDVSPELYVAEEVQPVSQPSAPYIQYLPAELVHTYTRFVDAAIDSQARGWQAFGELVVDTVRITTANIHAGTTMSASVARASLPQQSLQTPQPVFALDAERIHAELNYLVSLFEVPPVKTTDAVAAVAETRIEPEYLPYVWESFVETTYAMRDTSERVYGGIARGYVEYATAWFEYSARAYQNAIVRFVGVSVASGDTMATVYQALGEGYIAGFERVSEAQLYAYRAAGGASAYVADQFQYHAHEFALRVAAVVAEDVDTLQTASVWDALLEWYNSLGTSTEDTSGTAVAEPTQPSQPTTPVRSASAPAPSVYAAPSVVYIQPPAGNFVTHSELTAELQILSNELRSLVAEISASSVSSPTPPYVAAGGSGYLTVTASNSAAVTQTTINDSLEDYLPLTGGTISDDLAITGTASTTDLVVSGLGSGAGNCLTTNSSGVITTTTCGSGGGGAAFPFTPTTWGVSTSTTVGFTQGLLSTASSTFTSTLTLSNYTNGGLAVNASGAVYTFSTSTWTFASSTLLADSNTFSGANRFSSTTLTGNTLLTSATTTNLGITGITSSLLKTTSAGSVVAAVLGTDYFNFAYPFSGTGNSTSTLTQFNGGLTAYASSTIGAGGQTTGVTISGGATTTGNAYFAGNVGIGTNAPSTPLSISGAFATGRNTIVGISDTDGLSTNDALLIDFSAGSSLGKFGVEYDGSRGAFVFRDIYNSGAGSTEIVRIRGDGNVGIGTSSPYAPLSVVGQVVGAYFTATTTATSTFPNLLSTNATTTNLAVTGTASTSKLFADGLTSCNSASNALTWNAGAFGCNTITGGGGFSYTPTTNFGSTAVNSTSTPIWFTAGIMASSTSYIASTTFAVNGNVGVGSSTPWALLSVESKAGLDSFAIGSSTGTYFVVSSAGRVGVGTSTPFAPLSVTNSSSQLALAYDATRYASLAVDATGNLSLTTVNATTSLMNSNVTVCDNSACPTTWTATSTRGNLFVENAVVIGTDGFSLREIDSTSLGLYNASGQIMVIFDNGN